MVTRFSRTGWVLALAAAVASAALVVAGLGRGAPPSPASPAYEMVALPAGLDTLSSLEDAARKVEACTGSPKCTQVVLVWTPRMPLSRSSIPNVQEAARRVGAGLTLVSFDDLEGAAATEAATGDASERTGAALVDGMLAAGALAHAPSLVVYDGRGPVGAAILGYKTAEAYASMIADRLALGARREDGREPTGPTQPASASGVRGSPEVTLTALPDSTGSAAASPAEEAAPPVTEAAFRDFPAVGVPGAYFRWVPGRNALAYESDRRIYLLDLEDGRNRLSAGWIDFIPSPDGRYFVTPGPGNSGLQFFEAEPVFQAALSGRVQDVRPVHTDARMRDQYPSVGILGQDATTTTYRVLTSWFRGLLYRDYRVRHEAAGVGAEVTPLGPPVVPCEGSDLSIPIMSPDGLEVAARDETTGTTKVFRFRADGRCDEVVDVGTPTRKVAWHPTDRLLAFSTPRARRTPGGADESGIFLYDMERRSVTRVADSEAASRLAFPDFVGEDAVVFMVPGRTTAEGSYFRVVQPLP